MIILFLSFTIGNNSFYFRHSNIPSVERCYLLLVSKKNYTFYHRNPLKRLVKLTR